MATDPFLLQVVHKVSMAVIGRVVKYALSQQPKTGTLQISVDTSKHEDSMYSHLKQIAKWSSEIQVKSTRKLLSSILVEPVVYEGESRRILPSTKTLSPLVLLEAGANVVVLGGPGAGKTTTLKSIAQHMFSSQAISEDDVFNFPLLIKLRDLESEESIASNVLSQLGISVAFVPMIPGSVVQPSDDERRFLRQLKETVLTTYLNNCGALLLLDGLDEARIERISKLSTEIGRIASQLETSGIITTCRHGAYVHPVEGATVVSMRSFSPEQVVAFARSWFDGRSERADHFLASLDAAPYREMAQTPLHATNLCMIFDHYGDLPDQHTKIYDKIIDIRLREWDVDRGIVRVGKHRGFDFDEKRRFLSRVAFDLARNGAPLSFTLRQFERAAAAACRHHRLDVGSYRELLEEVEAHCGIILLTSFEKYEFIHKTIQEFLCAEYLSRVPLVSEYYSFLRGMPDTCALAAMRSNDPDLFVWCLWKNVFDLKNKAIVQKVHSETVSFWLQFLSRLKSENADFEGSELLAIGLLSPWTTLAESRDFHGGNDSASQLLEPLETLSNVSGVKESVSRLIELASPVRLTHSDGRNVHPLAQRVKGISGVAAFEFPVSSGAGSSLSLGTFEYPSVLLIPVKWLSK